MKKYLPIINIAAAINALSAVSIWSFIFVAIIFNWSGCYGVGCAYGILVPIYLFPLLIIIPLLSYLIYTLLALCIFTVKKLASRINTSTIINWTKTIKLILFSILLIYVGIFVYYWIYGLIMDRSLSNFNGTIFILLTSLSFIFLGYIYYRTSILTNIFSTLVAVKIICVGWFLVQNYFYFSDLIQLIIIWLWSLFNCYLLPIKIVRSVWTDQNALVFSKK